MSRTHAASLVLLLFATVAAQAQNKRAEKVRQDKRDVAARGDWHYDDLAAGTAEAKRTGRPLLVVIRCIP